MSENGAPVAHKTPEAAPQVQRWRCDVCQAISFPTFEEACRHEEECRTKNPTKPVNAFFQARSSAKSRFASGSVSSKTQGNVPKKRTGGAGQQASSTIRKHLKKTNVKKDLKPKKVAPSQDDIIELSDNDDVKAIKCRSSSIKKSNSSSAPLAPIFHGIYHKALMAEHAAAEFRAKRLMKEQQLREQRKRKEEQKALVGPPPAKRSVNAVLSSPRSARERRKIEAPRFPVPSHVIPRNDFLMEPKSTDHSLTPEQLLKARTALSQPIHPCNSSMIDILDDYGPLLLPADDPTRCLEGIDVATQLLSSILVPPPAVASGHELWIDKYGIQIVPDDLCSDMMKSLSEELVAFVQVWMGQRFQANHRMAERQRKFSNTQKIRKKKKPTKRKRIGDDAVEDFLWDDSDDEENRRKNVCLLTGPIGSGKTSLVHAVARACNCKVLEINTTDKRGATALRKAIEEATQSHSSLDMLKQRKAAMFGMNDLVDSDGEEDEDKLSAVTVILIDEVDILYDEHGDNGFWGALADLSKRSKCPIFLTSNQTPEGISALANRYMHFTTTPPTAAESVEFICKVATAVSFTFVDDSNSFGGLTLFAELCQFDVRRMIHELQLYALESPVRSKSTAPLIEPTSAPKDLRGGERPIIKGVQPKAVLWDTYKLLNIHGSHFMSLAAPDLSLGRGGFPVTVNIGGYDCPHARIMSDSVILAVKAPTPASLECANAEVDYLRITVNGARGLGLVSSTGGAISLATLHDDTETLAPVEACNLECHLQSHHLPASDDEDEEFEGNGRARPSRPDCFLSPSAPVVDQREAGRIVKEGIDSWQASIPEAKNEPFEEEASDCQAFAECAKGSCLKSDAAMIEDLGLTGTPFLSGPCAGFGFELTPAFPASNNENSKPPSEERLFSSGWKDDCYFYGDPNFYVSWVSDKRTRHLLTVSESTLRGQSVSQCEPVELTDESEKVELVSFQAREEDCLLRYDAPACLDALPVYLKQSASCDLSFDTILRERLQSQRKLDRMERSLDLLRDYIFDLDTTRTRLFARGMGREIDPLLRDTECAEESLFLDYLPMLRIMMLQERSRQSFLAQTTEQETSGRQKRSSRRSRNEQEQHYLERISSHFHRNRHVEGPSATEVGDELAFACLTILKKR